MSFSQNSKATYSDIVALKNKVIGEMDRRNYTNALKSTYGSGTTYDYNIQQYDKIDDTHQTKCITPVNQIAATGIALASAGNKIYPTLASLEVIIDDYATRAIVGTNSGCTNATCQGLCQGNCDVQCGGTCSLTGCGSSCDAGSCKTNCVSGNCKNNCNTSCNSGNTCGNTCSASCRQGCDTLGCSSGNPCGSTCSSQCGNNNGSR